MSGGRRPFLPCLAYIILLAGLMGCATAVTPPAPPAPTSTTRYQIQQTLTIVNHGPGQPEKQNLWLALIGTVRPYQEVNAVTITPDNYQLVTDEYGNQYAEFDLVGMPPGTEITVTAQYEVAVNEIEYNLTACQGNLPDFYTQSELHIESNNPQIVALANQLAAGKTTACEKIEAFYNYIGNTLVYSYNGRNWGAQAALGPMGADCTEYASLMIALSRAAGIPARYLEGLHYFPEQSEAIARTEHAWLEVYLPGIGWTPMDPTLGRSS
ncbi:MAG: transglutaminase domain-containing protein, partial [Anaerolineae bacterium]